VFVFIKNSEHFVLKQDEVSTKKTDHILIIFFKGHLSTVDVTAELDTP